MTTNTIRDKQHAPPFRVRVYLILMDASEEMWKWIWNNRIEPYYKTGAARRPKDTVPYYLVPKNTEKARTR